ncbi:MAG: hypothetical protein IKL53_11690 [Lachnospiraceae bacterium]|nr:hypothetical protein [Lachnospiraceae bacterium]
MRKIICKAIFIITVLATIVFVGFMIYMAICGLWVQFISLISSTSLMWFGFLNSGVFDALFGRESR